MIEVPRRRRSGLAIDLTPMIDIVFQLLIFFLLTATAVLPAIPLRLPETETAEGKAEDPSFVISITGEGQLFIGETPLPEEKLELVIQQRVSLRPFEHVIVRGDVEAHYGLFVRVLDACRKGGADQVLLETQETPPKKAE